MKRNLEGIWERAVRSEASFECDIVDSISGQLRDMYDAVVHEPLPDQFCELLSGLTRSRERA